MNYYIPINGTNPCNQYFANYVEFHSCHNYYYSHKLAENILDPTMFWSELNTISSVGKQISDTVGNAIGSKEIAQLFHEKYKALYNSVSTSEDELRLLRET